MDTALWQTQTRDQVNAVAQTSSEVKIHAKRKIVRDGVEEVWEQGVLSGPHGDIPFARPVKRASRRSSSQAASGTSAAQQQALPAPQQLSAPQQGDDTKVLDQGAPPRLLGPPAVAAEAPPPLLEHGGKQVAAAVVEGAAAAGEVSCSEEESVYESDCDLDAEAPRLQHTPFGPEDVAQLRAVLHRLREVTEVDSEASTRPTTADWEDVITKTCGQFLGMPQTPELTMQLRQEMAALEVAAAAATRRAHERRLVRQLAEMREMHRQWQQQVGQQAEEQLAEWSGHAVAQQLLDRAGASQEEFLQRLEDKVKRMQLLVAKRKECEQECRWLTKELVERFGQDRPIPAEVTPLPDYGSRTKNVAMAIQSLITQNFTDEL